MKFSDVRETLYHSNEIAWMPDNLEESVPFLCRINDVPMDGFLYWNQQGSLLEVEKMLAVSRQDGKLIALDADEIKQQFGLDTLTYQSPTITDYDEYFDKVDEYMDIYEKLCEDESAYEKYGEREYALLQDIVGSDVVRSLLMVVAEEFIKCLVKSLFQKHQQAKNVSQSNEVTYDNDDDTQPLETLDNE